MLVQLGLRILRGAVWTAALTVSAVRTRHACYNTADAFITAISQLHHRFRPARRKQRLTTAGDRLGGNAAKGSADSQLCSVDVAAGGAGLSQAVSSGSAVVSEV